MVRLSELKSTAQSCRPVKTTAALPDDIITQREDAEQAVEEEEQEEEQGEEDEQEAAVQESRPRRRRPARLPEATARAEPEERVRGRRQKDFDAAEHNESSDEESQKRERTRAAEEPWTQNQQKLLELALQQYPKGSSDRWDKIAKCVPSKSKVGEGGEAARWSRNPLRAAAGRVSFLLRVIRVLLSTAVSVISSLPTVSQFSPGRL